MAELLQSRIVACIEEFTIHPHLDIFSRCTLFDDLRRRCMVLRPNSCLSDEQYVYFILPCTYYSRRMKSFFDQLRKRALLNEVTRLIRGGATLIFECKRYFAHILKANYYTAYSLLQ